MTSINIVVTGASIQATPNGILTSGMVGVPVLIEYGDGWDGLIKTANFKAGDFVRSRKNVGIETTVPWEVMRHSGKVLEVGIEGRDEDGNIVIPTVWASVSTILPGSNSSIPGAPNPDSGDQPSGGGGADGTTFYPSVSPDGVISWTNDGGKKNPDPVDLVAAVISALPVYDGEVEAL